MNAAGSFESQEPGLRSHLVFGKVRVCCLADSERGNQTFERSDYQTTMFVAILVQRCGPCGAALFPSPVRQETEAICGVLVATQIG